MGKIKLRISRLAHKKHVTNIRVIKGVQDISIDHGSLTVTVDESLKKDEVIAISRKVRLITGLAYQIAFAESYDISMPSFGFHFTAQEAYKKDLLQREVYPTQKYLARADGLYEDILSSKPPVDSQDTYIFNLMYIWVKAQELQRLHQPVEARAILGEIIESIKEQGKEVSGEKVVKGLGIIQTPADKFAAKILKYLNRDTHQSSKDEFEGFTYLYRLRNRQKTIFQGNIPYYLGEKSHFETSESNPFLFEMTRLYILWLLGLDRYYLKRLGATYRVVRRTQ